MHHGWSSLAMLKNHTGCAGELLGGELEFRFWCKLIAICVLRVIAWALRRSMSYPILHVAFCYFMWSW